MSKLEEFKLSLLGISLDPFGFPHMMDSVNQQQQKPVQPVQKIQTTKEHEPFNICITPPAFNSSCTSNLNVPMRPPNGSSKTVNPYTTEPLQGNEDAASCTCCEEGMAATSRCKDCSEVLCDLCVLAHQRVKLTKDHRITRFSNISNPFNGSSVSLSSNSPCSSGIGSTQPPHVCDTHHEQLRLYCETCSSPACTECTLIEHREHQLLYIHESYDQARCSAVRLSMETRAATAVLRETIDTIQRSSDSFEMKMHQLMVDVRGLMKRYMNAIEDREREILTKIDCHKRSKYHIYKSQVEIVKAALGNIAVTSDILNDALEAGVGRELTVINERAISELKAVKDMRPEMMPFEEENVFFIAPDQNLLRAVSTMGSLSLGHNSLNIHTRGLRDLPVMPHYDIKIDEVYLKGKAKGKTIHGCEFSIATRDCGKLPIEIFGTEGEGDGELCRPWGVCCDKNGNIIIADRSNNRIQVFNADGTFIRKFGSQGNAPGQFDRPAGVAVDPTERIIVADKDNHRIQIFKGDGTLVNLFGEKGCRNGQFNYPWDVAVNTLGQIVVTDTRNHRIQLFSSEGVFLNKYGFEGAATMWKHFDSPRGICFSPNGRIIVTDFNNHRLVVVDPNFSHAQFLGQEGSGYKQFLRPQGIVCDDEGRIIIADSRNNRIQVFEESGNFLWKTGQSGKGIGELDRPSGIAINPQGRIVVVDFGNNRVQIF